MLCADDDGELQAFRASNDLYPQSTNFSDLPEFINSLDKNEDGKQGGKECASVPFNQANLLKHDLIYDEEMQVKLLKQRKIKVFKDSFDHLNQYPLTKEQRKLCNVFEDKLNI